MSYALFLILGIYLGFVLPYYIFRFLDKSKANKEYKSLMPTMVDESKMCKIRHEWTEAVGLRESGYDSVTMCSQCGFIPCMDMMATKKSLARLKENQKQRAIEKQMELEFEHQEHEVLQVLLEEIKKEPTFEKLYDVYRTGQSSLRRYALHKIVKMEQLKEEPNERREEIS